MKSTIPITPQSSPVTLHTLSSTLHPATINPRLPSVTLA